MTSLRILAALGAAVCAPLAPGATMPGPAADQVVFPTGMRRIDVPNVQAAITLGGKVLLKATDATGLPRAFNFGPTDERGGFVNLTADVQLLGETVSGHMTTLQGGFLPVRGPLPVRVTIEGIHFDHPGWVAIDIGRSSGLEITGNRITNVVGDPDHGEAIAVFMYNMDHPEQISGSLVIADNEIAVDEAGAATYADGIVIFGTTARLSIRGNRVTDAHTLGINVLAERRVSILGNIVVPGAGNPDVEYGNGVFVTTPLESGVVIRDNTVVCANPFADGIAVMGNGDEIVAAAIEGNSVEMHDSTYAGISLYGAVVDTRVSSNEVSGDGAYALQVGQAGGPTALGRFNQFLANDLSRFAATTADVFFDINASDNTLEGECASVLDLGTNNHYSCGSAPGETPAPPATAATRDRATRQQLEAVGRAIAVATGR